MTVSPKLGVVGIGLPLPIQMFLKVASSPRLSGIGMPSPVLWSHPLKMQRILLLSSLLWWELGTNSLTTGPGEWLSLRRFTSKLSWSWSLSLNFCNRFNRQKQENDKMKFWKSVPSYVLVRKYQWRKEIIFIPSNKWENLKNVLLYRQQIVYNVEPDMLSLSGQSISLKLKFPTT